MSRERSVTYVFGLDKSVLGGGDGIRTHDTGFPVYRFSKPAPSASRPPLQEWTRSTEPMNRMSIEVASWLAP